MNKKIVFCNCGGKLLKPEYKETIFSSLKEESIPFTKVSDLCGMCTSQQQDIRDLLSSPDEFQVIACYPRTVKLLLNKTGVETENRKMQFLNFGNTDPENLLEEIRNFHQSGFNVSEPAEMVCDSDWPAWFPIIDYSRCTSCGQCSEFCLFGVYEIVDKKVVVVNPEGCKNNCPACARICPHTAIIFPKYEHGGAIAGDESINEVEEQQRQQKDIDSILGSEIYQALERRKSKRQSIIRNNALLEAEKEREKALTENLKK